MTPSWSQWVRDLDAPLSVSERCVLYALASRMNGTGVCWPAARMIAHDTGLSPRHVVSTLRRLVDADLITMQHGKTESGTWAANRYSFNVCHTEQASLYTEHSSLYTEQASGGIVNRLQEGTEQASVPPRPIKEEVKIEEDNVEEISDALPGIGCTLPVKTPKRSKAKAKPTAKPRPDTWLTPFGKDWEEIVEGVAPYKQMASAFKGLLKVAGKTPDDIRRVWRWYLQHEDSKFLSPTIFAQRFGIFSDQANARPIDSGMPDKEAEP